MMKDSPLILLLDEPHPLLLLRLEAAGFVCRCMYHDSREAVLGALADARGVVMRSRLRVDRAFLEAGPGLQFIARLGVGVEHID
ncbi:MAG: hydroxyacid dehydrogenase, partial [Haliscomenobacter sp.]